MKDLYVSIGIPFFNCEKYLSIAIESVISQTHRNWELILIDDGSNDNSLEIAEKYAKNYKNIRVISDGINRGLPYRLNQIIDESKYQFIVRMDADDIMLPNRVEVQLKFLLEHSNYDLVSSGLISIDENSNITGYRNNYNPIVKDNAISYPICHPSVMGYKSWFLRNRYNEDFQRAEDFELWKRALKKGDLRIAICPDLLIFYREITSTSKAKIIRSYLDILRVMNHFNELNTTVIIKLISKIILTKLIYSCGGAGYLFSRRNKKLDQNSISFYQEILDGVLNKERLNKL